VWLRRRTDQTVQREERRAKAWGDQPNQDWERNVVFKDRIVLAKAVNSPGN